MEELGQQTVDFAKLVKQTVEESYLLLSELVFKGRSAVDGKPDDRTDSVKKIDLLKFVNRTRQRMLRLNVVTKWCQQVPLIQRAQQLQSTLSSHDTCFTQAADNLFFMHDGLQQARAPIYDVPSAVEILLTGNYQRLPKCIEDIGAGGALPESLQTPALRKLDSLVRSKILEISVPKEFSEINIKNGTVLLKVNGEFKALVTLGYRGHLSMWRILHLDLLVGRKSGPIRLEKLRRLALGDDLERRMSAASNPFVVLYSVVHELCVSLIMDTVIRQVQGLRLGRWKDAVRFDLTSDAGNVPTLLNQDRDAESSGIKTPGVKIWYWLDLEKNSDIISCPYLKIEPGPDLQICCTNSTFLIDPLKGQGAVFSLDQSCIDIEKLLLRTVLCHRYTRLFEIHKDLEKNEQINRSAGDVILHKFLDASVNDFTKTENEPYQSAREAPEVLQVRAYGSAYFTLGINIRNGRFLLRMSNSILSHSILSECQDALNQGTSSAADVFSSLRSRSILQLFASMGMFLGLQVYDDSFAASKVPKFLHNGSPMLLMGFPDCGSSYFLLLVLDKDFKLLFKMLESHSSDSENSVTEFDRCIKVDINQALVPENGLNSSLEGGDYSYLLPEAHKSLLEYEILPEASFDASMQSSNSSPNFSSIVEEVFQLEKGTFQVSPHEKRQKITGAFNSINEQTSSLYQIQSISSDFYPVGSQRITASKSDQNLASLTSLVKIDSFRSLNDDHLTATQSPAQNLGDRSIAANSLSLPSTPQSNHIGDSGLQSNPIVGLPTRRSSRKRKISDIINLFPTLKDENFKTEADNSDEIATRKEYNHATVSSEEKKGSLATSVYVSTLLSAVRNCSLCIKYARLTSQMDSQEIPYAEEVGLRSASSNIWFRLPFGRFDSSHHMCLRLGKPGTMQWDVKITDQHFRDLWELQKGSNKTLWGSGIRIANTSDVDSHIRYDPDGVVLNYQSVEDDSIKKLVADIRRLCYARMFAQGMRKLLGVRNDEKFDESKGNEANDKQLEQLRRTFKIEAVGLMSFWFSFGSGVIARFVVEWECDHDGCTMHVLPDQLWPHTKFLEEFVNEGEVVPLLDCIRLTAGPLHALAAATRPARAGPTPTASVKAVTGNAGFTSSQSTGMLGPNRNGPGIVPNSLLPIDVSVVLRGPYWIRVLYRKHFAVDMRCFAGDQVWLQPATPPHGGPSVGGSLPCPQFRPFIMEHVAQELNGLDPSISIANSGNNLGPQMGLTPSRPVFPSSSGLPNRPIQTLVPVLSSVSSVLSDRRQPGANVPAHVRGDLNTAIIGLGDDGGYGGGWVPLVALKKVLRGILKYLGVLWLFAQLPDLLKEILGSVLKENEGALLNLDQEQPALRFFVGGYVFAVSVHRVQLLLQVLSVRRFHNQQQHQQSQQQQQSSPQAEELTQTEIGEICDFFSRRVASEPYDASRVASFITLLTLPISVLREFLKLIAWKKGLPVSHGGEVPPGQKPRIELCLENHQFEMADAARVARSNVIYDRVHSAVDFAVTLILDPAHIPNVNAAGGAGWLPYCVSVRLRYTFGSDTYGLSLLTMEGSHGGRACWTRVEDWDKCKQLVARTVEVTGVSTTVDPAIGRLKSVADSVQRTLNMCLQGLRDGDAL